MKLMVVLTHYRRPENVAIQLESLRGQTRAPDAIVVVDNSPEGEPAFNAAAAERVFRLKGHDYGPSCRFAPALMDNDHDYFLFIDDDVLPGPSFVADFCDNTTRPTGTRFTGIIGRIFREGAESIEGEELGPSYVRKNVGRAVGRLSDVSMTCRVHFAHRSAIDQLVPVRAKLYGLASSGGMASFSELLRRNDDIWLAAAARLAGFRPQLLPLGMAPIKNIPEPHWAKKNPVAACAKPDHDQLRNDLLKAMRVRCMI